ncbi:hypothetical protein OXX59_002700 [Metschnikowia pulcherrima]
MSTWRKKHRRPPPEDKQTIHFEPRRDPGKKTHILVKVSYDRTEDVQRYFRWNFLTPQDVVEKWRSPEIVGTKTKRHVTHVSLVLGQENVPPKTASQACWEDHFSVVQDQLKFWMEWIQNIEVGVYKPDQEHDIAEYNTFLEELKNEQDVTATELIQIVKYRPNAPAHKQFNMSCEVVRAPNFCHLCRTVAHPLALCEAKGCTVCGSRNHPHYKCAKKCTCKTRPLHLASECPLKSGWTASKQEVSLRRLQKGQRQEVVAAPRLESPKTFFGEEQDEESGDKKMGSETSISDAGNGIEGVELNLRDFHLTRKKSINYEAEGESI